MFECNAKGQAGAAAKAEAAGAPGVDQPCLLEIYFPARISSPNGSVLSPLQSRFEWNQVHGLEGAQLSHESDLIADAKHPWTRTQAVGELAHAVSAVIEQRDKIT